MSQRTLEDFYSKQAKGYDLDLGIRQKGSGLGSILGVLGKRYAIPLFNAALPYIKKGANIVGKEILKEGEGLIDDIIGGNNVIRSVKKRGGRGLSNLIGQIGKGRKRKRIGQIGTVRKRIVKIKRNKIKRNTNGKKSKRKRTLSRKDGRSILSRK